MMIVGKDSVDLDAKNPLSRSSLCRKDMRRGRQVLLYVVGSGVAVEGTIMSSPFDETEKRPDRENGQNILLRNDEQDETHTRSLYGLGVIPNEDGEWNPTQFLLDANRYDKLSQFDGSADANDPPDRS